MLEIYQAEDERQWLTWKLIYVSFTFILCAGY
jgi:hypothetical protein